MRLDNTTLPNHNNLPAGLPSHQSGPGVSWLLAGGHEPTALVDDARAVLGNPARCEQLLGFRVDAPYRRRSAGEGGRPHYTAAALEDARRGLDRHRGREWTDHDRAIVVELEARAATVGDIGARVGRDVPPWFFTEGTDGALLVPRVLHPFCALVWWMYASGRIGLLASVPELAALLGVSPRTVRAWRALAVQLGLIRRGTHKRFVKAEPPDGERVDVEVAHDEADRTWRAGKFDRPCDRAKNLYRLGPVLESFAGMPAPAEAVPPGIGERRRARRAYADKARLLRRAARVSSFRRVGEHWDAEVARLAPVDAAGAPSRRPRGPRPVDPARLARTVVVPREPRPVVPSRRDPAAPHRVPMRSQGTDARSLTAAAPVALGAEAGAPRSKVIGRQKLPCTPDPCTRGPQIDGGAPWTPGNAKARRATAPASWEDEAPPLPLAWSASAAAPDPRPGASRPPPSADVARGAPGRGPTEAEAQAETFDLAAAAGALVASRTFEPARAPAPRRPYAALGLGRSETICPHCRNTGLREHAERPRLRPCGCGCPPL